MALALLRLQACRAEGDPPHQRRAAASTRIVGHRGDVPLGPVEAADEAADFRLKRARIDTQRRVRSGGHPAVELVEHVDRISIAATLFERAHVRGEQQTEQLQVVVEREAAQSDHGLDFSQPFLGGALTRLEVMVEPLDRHEHTKRRRLGGVGDERAHVHRRRRTG